jgi:hypothetical protein
MELVNGVKNQRAQIEIIMGALENVGIDSERGLQKFIAYAAVPNLTQAQINNTVFMYVSKAKGDKELEAVCTVFNLDTRDNLPANLIEFFALLQSRAVTGATFQTKDGNVFRAFLNATPYLEKSGTKAGIWQKKTESKFLGRVLFGEDKIGKEL